MPTPHPSSHPTPLSSTAAAAVDRTGQGAGPYAQPAHPQARFAVDAVLIDAIRATVGPFVPEPWRSEGAPAAREAVASATVQATSATAEPIDLTEAAAPVAVQASDAEAAVELPWIDAFLSTATPTSSNLEAIAAPTDDLTSDVISEVSLSRAPHAFVDVEPAPPVEAAIEQPIESVFEVAPEAVFEAPVEAVVESPVEESVHAPIAAVVESPVEESFEAPIAAVVEAPVEALFNAPIEALVEARAETLFEAPVEAGTEVPVETLFETPVEAAREVVPADVIDTSLHVTVDAAQDGAVQEVPGSIEAAFAAEPVEASEEWPMDEAASAMQSLAEELRPRIPAPSANGNPVRRAVTPLYVPPVASTPPLPMWDDDAPMDIMPVKAPKVVAGEPWAESARRESERAGNPEAAARALETLARKVRQGEIELPGYSSEMGDAAALAAALAALLGVRR